MIYIIEDNLIFANCIARYCDKKDVKIFSNAIEAMNQIDKTFPDLIFLDVLLTGPDGFTFLNEIASYSDTAKIPIVIISSLDLKDKDLSVYGVVGVLNKDSLVPKEVKEYVKRYTY